MLISYIELFQLIGVYLQSYLTASREAFNMSMKIRLLMFNFATFLCVSSFPESELV